MFLLIFRREKLKLIVPVKILLSTLVLLLGGRKRNIGIMLKKTPKGSITVVYGIIYVISRMRVCLQPIIFMYENVLPEKKP